MTTATSTPGPARATLTADAPEPALAPHETLVTGEFGALLRTFRERLSPETAGIRPTPPQARRVPGLRRDELARLASVSEDHLKRLEQGRRRPSRAMVDALAGALRLDRPDHARLRLLAGFAAPRSRPALHRLAPQAPQSRLLPGPPGAGLVPREITAPARRLLDRLTVPVCVCDASWTILGGNRRWVELGCSLRAGQHDRNVAWWLFTRTPTAVVGSAEDLTGFKSCVVAGLRAAVRRYPADPQLRDLVADLRAVSEDFGRRWLATGSWSTCPDQLSVHRRSAGETWLDKDVLNVEPGDLRVLVFTPAAR